MAGSTVVALGAGTVILLVLWTVTGFLWFFFHRSQSVIRYVVLMISSVVTLILFILPPETGKDHIEQFLSDDDDIIYDYMFIWKAIVIMILAVSLIGGIGFSISEYWTMKVHGSKAVPRRNAKTASGLTTGSSLTLKSE